MSDFQERLRRDMANHPNPFSAASDSLRTPQDDIEVLGWKGPGAAEQAARAAHDEKLIDKAIRSIPCERAWKLVHNSKGDDPRAIAKLSRYDQEFYGRSGAINMEKLNAYRTFRPGDPMAAFRLKQVAEKNENFHLRRRKDDEASRPERERRSTSWISVWCYCSVGAKR